MTLFNIFALHVCCWSSGMILALHGECPGFDTHTLLCGNYYFLLLTVLRTFCSLFLLSFLQAIDRNIANLSVLLLFLEKVPGKGGFFFSSV